MSDVEATETDQAAEPLENSTRVDRGLRQPERTLSVRVPLDLLDQLVALSIVDEGTVADQLRTGLRHYVDWRRSRPSFPSELEQARARRLAELASLQNDQQSTAG